MTTYSFTLPCGKIETRASKRPYTHVVLAETAVTNPHFERDGASPVVIAWASSAANAEKAAKTYGKVTQMFARTWVAPL